MASYLDRAGRALERRLANPREGGIIDQLRRLRRYQLRRRAVRAAPKTPPPVYEALAGSLDLLSLRPRDRPRNITVLPPVVPADLFPSPTEAELRRWLSESSEVEDLELALLEAEQEKLDRARARRQHFYDVMRARRQNGRMYDHNIARDYLPLDIESWWREDVPSGLNFDAISAEYLGPRDEMGRIPIFRKDYMQWMEDLFRWPDGTVQALYARDEQMCELVQQAWKKATGRRAWIPVVWYPEPSRADQKPFFDLHWQSNAERLHRWEFEQVLNIYHSHRPLVEAAHNLLTKFVARREVEFEREASRLGFHFTAGQIQKMSDREMESFREWFRDMQKIGLPDYRSEVSRQSVLAPSYKSNPWIQKPASPQRPTRQAPVLSPRRRQSSQGSGSNGSRSPGRSSAARRAARRDFGS